MQRDPDNLRNRAYIDSTSRNLIDEFVAQADVAPSTRVKYRAHLNEYASWLNHPRVLEHGEAPRNVTSATAADVHRFMSYLRAGDRFAAHSCVVLMDELSPSTRKSFLASLRSLYRYLVAVRIVSADPSAAVRTPRVPLRPGLTLSESELRRLRDAVGPARERIQTFLLIYTAARAGELDRLRWGDIDLATRTIVLHGKNDKHRTVDIHPRLLSELRRWFIYQEQLAERNPAIRAAKAHPDSDYVLLTRNGRPLAPGTISKQLKRRAARVGLHITPDGPKVSAISPHALRRSFATMLLNSGHHLDAVADVLGHASLDTTRKHYAFASTARRRSTIEAFNP